MSRAGGGRITTTSAARRELSIARFSGQPWRTFWARWSVSISTWRPTPTHSKRVKKDARGLSRRGLLVRERAPEWLRRALATAPTWFPIAFFLMKSDPLMVGRVSGVAGLQRSRKGLRSQPVLGLCCDERLCVREHRSHLPAEARICLEDGAHAGMQPEPVGVKGKPRYSLSDSSVFTAVRATRDSSGAGMTDATRDRGGGAVMREPPRLPERPSAKQQRLPCSGTL